MAYPPSVSCVGVALDRCKGPVQYVQSTIQYGPVFVYLHLKRTCLGSAKGCVPTAKVLVAGRESYLSSRRQSPIERPAATAPEALEEDHNLEKGQPLCGPSDASLTSEFVYEVRNHKFCPKEKGRGPKAWFVGRRITRSEDSV